MQPGTKIKMTGERCRYTVMASSRRWAVLTKPFNAKRTYLYTIVDLERKVRGPCDLIFGPPAELNTGEGAAYAMAMLHSGGMGVSGRRNKPLTEEELGQLQ